ncbi:MAG: antitoxin [Knoellia sp.]
MARGAIKFAALAGLAKQARGYAQKNPESVSSTIGKVEDAVGRRVGPKYAAHVGKGGKALRSGLGISTAQPTPPTPPAPEVTPPPSS